MKNTLRTAKITAESNEAVGGSFLFQQHAVLLRSISIDLLTVFSTFDMDKLRKICRHHWKERL